MNPPLSRPDYAERRFLFALEYNPHFAPAHLNLWRLYSTRKDTQKAEEHLRVVKRVWRDADRDFRIAHQIPE